MACMRLTLLGLLLVAAPALAQSGAFRLERADAQGRPSAGLLIITGDRYERRTRDALDQPVTVERGRARAAAGGELVLEPESIGLAGALSGATAPAPRRLTASPGGGWSAAGERLVSIPVSQAGHDVRLLVDGEAFVALRAELRAAQRSIDHQVYHFADDDTGRSVADCLAERARAGVAVRLLVDHQSKAIGKLLHGKGYVDLDDGLDDRLRGAGADVRFHHSLGENLKESVMGWGRGLGDLFRRGPAPAREDRSYGVHDHRKYVVVDRRVALLGGQNVADDYEKSWHDVQVRLEGPAVGAVEALFADRWTRSAGGPASPAPLPVAVGPGDVQVEVLGSLPGLPDPIRARYLAELGRARSAKLALAFVDDDAVLAALGGVARRGGRAVLLLPGDDAHVSPLAKETLRWVLNDVAASGVEVWKLKGRMLHMKLGTFDGRAAIVGSDNLNDSKLAESVAVVTDPRFARLVDGRIFEQALPRAERHVLRPLTWKERLKSGSIRFVLRHLL